MGQTLIFEIKPNLNRILKYFFKPERNLDNFLTELELNIFCHVQIKSTIIIIKQIC